MPHTHSVVHEKERTVQISCATPAAANISAASWRRFGRSFSHSIPASIITSGNRK